MFAFPPGFDPVQVFNGYFLVCGPWLMVEIILVSYFFLRSVFFRTV